MKIAKCQRMNTKSPWVFLVILVTFGLTVWTYYWKLQLMYNSSSVSLYTPDSFPVSKKNFHKHQKTTNLGFRYAKTRRLVIAGMVRNVKSNLPGIEKRAEKLGALFQDYRILVVENDSTDGTREYLLNWAKRNPRVTVLGCGRNAHKCSLNLKATEGHSISRSRIEKMAYLRNIYLREVKERYSDFDYLAVWDMDIVGSVYLDGVANTMGHFLKDPEIGAMCAYGIYQWGPLKIYYDTYATLEEGDNFHIDSKTLHDIQKGLGMQYQRGESPIKMVSCFSGFTIYRDRSVLPREVYYDTTPKEDPLGNLECEHVRLHKKMTVGRNQIKMNPSMIHLVILND